MSQIVRELLYVLAGLVVIVLAMILRMKWWDIQYECKRRRKEAVSKRLMRLSEDELTACACKKRWKAGVALELLIKRRADDDVLEKIGACGVNSEAVQAALDELCKRNGHQMQVCFCTRCKRTIHQGTITEERIPCPACDGTGSVEVGGGVEWTSFNPCNSCGGRGYI